MISRCCIAVLTIGSMLMAYTSYGQINVKVGYNVISPQIGQVDDLLRMYRPTTGEVSKPFGRLAFMHGIGLGLRYKMGNTSIEADWSSMTTEKSAITYLPSSDSFDEVVYDFGVKGFSIGIDQYVGRFGFGSALTSTNFNIKRPVGQNDLEVSSEHQYHLQLRLLWQIQQSDQVSLELRPYYQFSLGDYSFDRLASDLNVSSVDEFSESPSYFGLSLIFYNGRH